MFVPLHQPSDGSRDLQRATGLLHHLVKVIAFAFPASPPRQNLPVLPTGIVVIVLDLSVISICSCLYKVESTPTQR